MSTVSTLLSKLSPDDRKRLLARLSQAGTGRQAAELTADRIARRENHEAPAPLSFSQQRIWFATQLSPDQPYNVAVKVRLTGVLDLPALEGSINQVVARHEILRTRFEERDGGAAQCVLPSLRVPLVRLDLQGDSDERSEQLDAIVRLEAEFLFDLGKAPLIRTNLVSIGENDHLLLITMHHILCDNWSLGILDREISQFYQAFSKGESPNLPPLQVQYADFADWQHRQLQTGALRNQLLYWKRNLGTNPRSTQLPPDNVRVMSSEAAPESQSISLPKRVVEHLCSLSVLHGCTVNMVMLAAFNVLLSRLTGQDETTIGITIAGRTRSETEPLIGFFVNTVPVRMRVLPDRPFTDVLTDTRETLIEAYANQDLPFEKLVEELQPKRSGSRHPIFEILFNYLNALDLSEGLDSTLNRVTLHEPIREWRVPLSLHVLETGEGMQVEAAYLPSLYTRQRIELLLDQYSDLLTQVVGCTNTPIGTFSLVSPKCRTILPNPHREIQLGSYGHALHDFARWALAFPERAAIVHGTDRLTYGELATNIRTLQATLREADLTQRKVAAIIGPRCPATTVAAMAIFAQRGVVLNIDPSWPSNRINGILRAAGVSHIVLAQTDSINTSRFATEDRTIIRVDTRTGLPEGKLLALGGEICELSISDPAYIVFTSGSTGMPKGVLGGHLGLSHFVTWEREEFGFGPQDRVPQLAAPSVDVIYREVFLALTSGATLYLAPEGDDLGADCVLPWMQKHRISVVHTTPSVAHSWITQTPEGVSLNEVRRVFLVGERLTHTLVSRWREAFPHCGPIVNLYGSTETNLAKMYYPVPENLLMGVQPVGRPLPETDVLVVGSENMLCGVGEIGEIQIRTPTLALGYIGQEFENTKRFGTNPVGASAVDRIFRTGDLGRYRADGLVEVLGRLDDQIKVRGMRVEPGEVSSVLARMPDVAAAAVVAGKDWEDQDCLIAYIVPRSVGLKTDAVRAFLEAELPTPSIPAAIITVHEMPILQVGKLNSAALPPPNWARLRRNSWYQAPRTMVEQVLADLWSNLLRVERVGIGDNFFELGGHSLLATQLLARMRRVFDLQLPLHFLFESPTIAQVAAEIERNAKKELGLEFVPPEHCPTPAIPLSFSQERFWFLSQLAPGAAAYNMQSTLFARGRLKLKAFGHTLVWLVARHETLRTRIPSVNGVPEVVIGDAAEMVLNIVDLSAGAAEQVLEEVRKLARADRCSAFNLSKVPPLRVTVVRLSETEHVFLLSIHHIAADAWSFSVLIREMKAAYEALSEDRPLNEPSLEWQYRDYAYSQRRRLSAGKLKRLLEYWRGQVQGVPALDLPTDHPRPERQGFGGGQVELELGQDLTSRLEQLGRDNGATLYMTLLAGFEILLGRYSRQDRMLIGTATAGRNRLEWEPLIGVFVNTLVLRGDLSGNPRVNELIEKVRQVCLEGYVHQELPFEKLVEDQQPERDLSRHPLFQVMFVFQNVPKEELAGAGGLRWSSVPGLEPAPVTKFDLTLIGERNREGLQLRLEYSTELYEAATAERMLEHYRRLLEEMAARPESHIADLAMLDGSERQQLLKLAQGPSLVVAAGTVIDWIEQQATQQPDAVVLYEDSRSMRFAELNERANRVAWALRELGVREESRVGLCMSRTIEMVVALLATLKAGAAYVPLEASLPIERLCYMLSDAGVEVVIGEHAVHTEWGGELHTVSQLETAAGERAVAPERRLSSQHLAYVIYTSGSTGRPKGVMVTHGGLVNYLSWALQAYAHEGTGAPVHSPLAFDLTVTSILVPLVAAQSVRLIVDDELEALSRSLHQQHNFSLVKITPAHLQILNELLPAGVRAGLARCLVIGGEQLYAETLQPWRREAPATRLINEYGPTETVVGCCVYEVNEQTPHKGPVPIGHPIPNTAAYVLDDNLEPVPPGMPGELYLAGAGLARGYQNAPHMTAERFLPHPFGAAGERLYRTGDLVRYLLDGNLTYLGRLDQQVKVRGWRIELGEIERLLAEHASVKDAAVVLLPQSNGSPQIVAYLVPRESALDVASVQQWLRNRLPSYMLPNLLCPIARLPLTSNGKLDRRALPEPPQETQTAFVAPRNDREACIAKIWTVLLDVERVSVHDNFFGLGGNSLLATQFISRVRAIFGHEAPVAWAFEYPTIAQFAAVLPETSEVAHSRIQSFQDAQSAELADNVDRLSDDEITRLLRNLLAK